MKESDARNKWCPHVRVLSDEGSMVISTVNRGNGLQAVTECIGSDCMMWEPEYVEQTDRVENVDDVQTTREGNEELHGMEGWHIKNWSSYEKWIEYVRWNQTDKGDCGLKTKESGCFYPG